MPSLLLYGLLALAVLGALSGIAYKIHDAGYEQAKLECTEAAAAQRAAEATVAAAAATKKESGDAKARVIYRTITRDVDRIVERPVYRNVCLDSDGLRSVNAALSGALTPAAEPAQPMPATDAPIGRDGGERPAQDR